MTLCAQVRDVCSIGTGTTLHQHATASLRALHFVPGLALPPLHIPHSCRRAVALSYVTSHVHILHFCTTGDVICAHPPALSVLVTALSVNILDEDDVHQYLFQLGKLISDTIYDIADKVEAARAAAGNELPEPRFMQPSALQPDVLVYMKQGWGLPEAPPPPDHEKRAGGSAGGAANGISAGGGAAGAASRASAPSSAPVAQQAAQSAAPAWATTQQQQPSALGGTSYQQPQPQPFSQPGAITARALEQTFTQLSISSSTTGGTPAGASALPSTIEPPPPAPVKTLPSAVPLPFPIPVPTSAATANMAGGSQVPIPVPVPVPVPIPTPTGGAGSSQTPLISQVAPAGMPMQARPALPYDPSNIFGMLYGHLSAAGAGGATTTGTAASYQQQQAAPTYQQQGLYSSTGNAAMAAALQASASNPHTGGINQPLGVFYAGNGGASLIPAGYGLSATGSQSQSVYGVGAATAAVQAVQQSAWTAGTLSGLTPAAWAHVPASRPQAPSQQHHSVYSVQQQQVFSMQQQQQQVVSVQQPTATSPATVPAADDQPWQCSVCTYQHEGPEVQFLSCAVCGSPRVR